MELSVILEQLSVINRDNGRKFTQTDRLDAVSSLLWDSKYRRVNSDGLFNLYSQKPLDYFKDKKVLVVSSHVDCENEISKCFTSIETDEMMRGTYDNAITNAAIVSAMLSDELPDEILVAFTGDEEISSKGAKHLLKFLQSKKINIHAILVLDVTDMGWNENADFTIENNFWNKSVGQKAIQIAEESDLSWCFVPSDVNNIPAYIPSGSIIHEEAEEDESWYYDEESQICFSFCLPVYGEMHSDNGVLVRKEAFYNYSKMLATMLRRLLSD